MKPSVTFYPWKKIRKDLMGLLDQFDETEMDYVPSRVPGLSERSFCTLPKLKITGSTILCAMNCRITHIMNSRNFRAWLPSA